MTRIQPRALFRQASVGSRVPVNRAYPFSMHLYTEKVGKSSAHRRGSRENGGIEDRKGPLKRPVAGPDS